MSKTPRTAKKQAVTNPAAQPTITADTVVVTSPYFERDRSENIFHLRARDTDTPEPRCSFADRTETDWQATTRGDLPEDASLCEWCDPSVDHLNNGPTHSLAAKLADPNVRSVADLDHEDLVTDGGQTLACPECGSTKNIFRRAPGRHNSTIDPNEDVWRCSDCGADFDEPARRDRQRKGGRRGLAGRLAAADADAVSADRDDSTLVPDGGEEIADTFEAFTDPQTDPERRCDRCGDVIARKYLHEGVCVGCRYRGQTPTREPLTDGGRAPPDVDDVVAAPADTTCDLWLTPEGPCGKPAVVLYVYDHNTDERPMNALACDEHAPAYPEDDTDTDLRTDGGHLERPDVEHGKQWYSLRAFQRDCLVAVSVYTDARPPSGREIQSYLERWYHDTVHHSQLYTNLDTLVEAGLLEKTNIDGRTNGYRLTAEGEAVLDRGAAQLQRAANGGEKA